jgi:heptosyltransferase-1
MRALLIKMSSLGDVVHTLPAVSDAARAGVTFDWVVEEAFAAIPRRHAAVEQVIPIAWRRWRHALVGSRAEMAGFFRRLRAERYDCVIDAQGLWKSAAVTALARAGPRWGFAYGSAREGPASWFYSRRVPVPRDQHAVTRLRSLFAAVFGYEVDAQAESSGLDHLKVEATDEKTCVFCHGTTWPSKEWPEPMWRELARELGQAGYQVLLPWGNSRERDRARAIARGTGACVLDPLPLERLMDVMGQASLVVGVDSGLSHLAGALGVPTVVVYGSTSSALTGSRGSRVANLASEFPCSPCRSRTCAYRGPRQSWRGQVVEPACYAMLGVEQVTAVVEKLDDRCS